MELLDEDSVTTDVVGALPTEHYMGRLSPCEEVEPDGRYGEDRRGQSRHAVRHPLGVVIFQLLARRKLRPPGGRR